MIIIFNQADEIRKLAKKYLNSDNNNLYEISKDPIVKGIRYSVLKEMIFKENNAFSNGSVTGALYSLIKKDPDIKKIKTKKGTFYFDSSKYSFDLDNSDIVENENENKFKNIDNDIDSIINNVRFILSGNKVSSMTKIDTDYLFNILDNATNMKKISDDYKSQKIKDSLITK